VAGSELKFDPGSVEKQHRLVGLIFVKDEPIWLIWQGITEEWLVDLRRAGLVSDMEDKLVSMNDAGIVTFCSEYTALGMFDKPVWLADRKHMLSHI